MSFFMSNQQPNIVMIVLDTHRVDRLSCYGYSKKTSPNIDHFSDGATIYQNAISPAQWTIPAHASMFTGEYPSYHQTIQASHALSADKKTFIEILSENGYDTYGFCNNPLVGVLNNGLRRGFKGFYNYGGAVLSPYERPEEIRKPSHQLKRIFQKIIQPIATPIQQKVADSADVFQFILNPRIVALWTRHANFKGDTGRSLRDAYYLFSKTNQNKQNSPQFFFINLMGTHLPYTPPRRFMKKFAENVLESPETKQFINFYNTQALKWLLPLHEPYPPSEFEALSAMYDAEVAYQDHLLQQFLALLSTEYHKENTMVIIVSDHGEMLGEHQIMGHGLGVYQELVHVPMIIREPGQTQQKISTETVSTKNIYQMVLSTAGVEADEISRNPYTYTEAYPPDNVIRIMEKHEPELLKNFNSQRTNWAIYNDIYKLTRVDGVGDYLFNLGNGSNENHPLLDNESVQQDLSKKLDDYLLDVEKRINGDFRDSSKALEIDEKLKDRLRGLGYLE